MWNGTFALRKSIEEHFDVINIRRDEIVGIVYVTVIFHKSPNQQYVFEINEDDFEPTKEAIGKEILSQLKA